MHIVRKIAILSLLAAAVGASLSACSTGVAGLDREAQVADGSLGRPAERFEGNGGYNGGP